ncbi:60S ribosomal export protein NMD3 [Phlebotomus argentipes]|uniref:60S ribosomal export protein NMD3 n=1 Tax=Phlebotomus argentipes TaxID=94469 RepID=UPI00289362E1|nr:60S ribosomal export protein NMD3 [Phlebotomus argentipes]
METDSMETSAEVDSSVANILCCECGVVIAPNPANMCVACLRTHVDITEGIPKQAVLQFCRNCERYLQPPNEWVQCSLESRELLAICLKRLKGLKEVKLIDAGFIWTEPHSKRLKVKLTVQGEVLGGAVLQQVFVVEFTVNNQMCDDCHRTEAKDFWRCVVQIRQRSENKKTFYYLEQLILKHRVHENTLGIKPMHGGLDMFYANESHARRMVDFMHTMLPVKTSTSKRLISHDIHSNSYNYKYTFAVDIVPLSKDSLVCLSKKMQQQLGSIAPLCLVRRVASVIHLIDPLSTQIAELNSTVFYRSPFEPICNPKSLQEYIVMDIEIIPDKNKPSFPGQGKVSHKHLLCDVWLVKAAELGINENTIHTRTHLGHILKPSDTVLGYNLEDANINDDSFEKLDKTRIPDVIIVKKHFGDSAERMSYRRWKLKHLDAYTSNRETDSKEYREFLDDLEEDPDYRQHVNIYKDPAKQLPVDTNDMPDPSVPRITLEEMLDDLTLDDVDME